MSIISREKILAVSLFEVLIAIIIFGVGILTLFSMITVNISWLNTLRQKDMATMLAKESLEIIYNIRDTNQVKGLPWNCTHFDENQDNNCGGYFYLGDNGMTLGTGTHYIISRNDIQATGFVYKLTEVYNINNTWIYSHTGSLYLSGDTISNAFWYDYDTGNNGIKTQYQRYITFIPSPLYPNNTGNVLQVSSRVIANPGSKQQEIILESMIGCIFNDGDCF